MAASTDDASGYTEHEIRSIRGLVDLLGQRPELRGIYAPADSFDEHLRWSA